MDQCLCYRGIRYQRSPVELSYILKLREETERLKKELAKDLSNIRSEKPAVF